MDLTLVMAKVVDNENYLRSFFPLLHSMASIELEWSWQISDFRHSELFRWALVRQACKGRWILRP